MAAWAVLSETQHDLLLSGGAGLGWTLVHVVCDSVTIKTDSADSRLWSGLDNRGTTELSGNYRVLGG